MHTELLIIDPQNDFCAPDGALSVPGADADMTRLAALVDRMGPTLDTIHVTLDTHQRRDISHPLWWRDAHGAAPPPFTLIRSADLEAGRWVPRDPADTAHSRAYLAALEAKGRYPHTIWPEHCLRGDAGHNVFPALSAALHRWEGRGRNVHFVIKGTHPGTEHFSAIAAEVPLDDAPHTQVNRALVERLEAADRILVAGEALSHCVASTVRDIADHFRDPASVHKLVLLRDATSSVPDPPGTTLFSDGAAAFLEALTGRGMQLADCAEF